MRLLRLKLENWRGVDAREVEFAQDVTLIEGPNEIGKSTIVEAIQNLFTVMDSSNKADIKAIQPVGSDVGSSVVAEVEAGEYHFVYSKTYNKNKQTELRVLSPQQEQLTGREAHERAEQILEEAVDMALWNALLVEQGNEIAGVTLSQSDGLARALDEAAGGESPDQDDSDLFERVQGEYEKYFTLKSGKPKHAPLEAEVIEAQEAWEAAKAALAEIETDSDNYDRCQAEIQRLENKLPDLVEEEEKYQAEWQAVSKVKGEVTVKEGQLKDAQELLRLARDEVERRNTILKSIEDGKQAISVLRELLAPKAEALAGLKENADGAAKELAELKARLREARSVSDLNRADVQHLENVSELEEIKRKLERYQQFSSGLELARKALQGVKINTDGLNELRDASNKLEIAIARRDTASSSIEITAEEELSLTLNDEALSLAKNASDRRDIASQVNLRIPGVVGIRVTPSQSANELEVAVDERRATLARLFEKYGVTDLSDAIAVEAKRAENQRDVASWREKINDLLGGESAADLEALRDDLQLGVTEYVTARKAEPSLPGSLQQAQQKSAEAGETLVELEDSIEVQQSAADDLQDQYTSASAQNQLDQQELSGQEILLKQRQQELEQSRAVEADAALDARVKERSVSAASLLAELKNLQEQLESASPDAAEALWTNAQAARKRAEKDLTTQRTELAVLEDRLTKAQADGRYETLEEAEYKFLALEDEFRVISARAAAASRLWQVVNAHRDAARKAYVRPLKEGVEQLGKIVFGTDFAIELGDDWGLVSRTQDGRTIPFDDLSVGAKEQLGILLRLAAARIVSKQGGVPLIIDDALGFSDPTRLKMMGAAIASAGADCQIILLTCTPGRFTHVGSAEVVRF